jgi:hypothetical protein
LLDDGDRCWPHEHPPPHLTVEIALPLNTAIILAALIVQLNSNPVARREVRLSEVPNRCGAAIGQLDGLAKLKLVRHVAQVIEEAPPWISRGRIREYRVGGV